MQCEIDLDQCINIAGIETDSVVDGPGVRTTIFVQGCPHYCPGCHNPQAQGVGGYYITPEGLAEGFKNEPYVLRLTLSGGEPMAQAKQLTKFLSALALSHDLDIWVYSGYTWEEIMAQEDMSSLVKLCDVLVDGRFDISLRDPDLLFKGSSNQRIIDIQKSLERGEIVLWSK